MKCFVFFQQQVQGVEVEGSASDVCELLRKHQHREGAFSLCELPTVGGGSAFVDPERIVLIIDKPSAGGGLRLV